MRIKFDSAKTCGTILGVLLVVAIFLALAAVSWIATCGVIKLITMCFGWTFSWGWATGIWLVMFLLRSTFRVTVKK